ncbi:hypothetical protein JM949_08430 [Micromonospora sp. STR1s_6]|uniref:Uncharacterized protein n=1 Tax=Micromonospora tarensis TaxID=2806100 RepID=A0ABS1YDP4_9ACTN|nr:hypothetical protein [Micromonospora tarensis]
MTIVRSWWRLRYPAYLLGVVAGMVMMWLPVKTFNDNGAWEDRLRAEGVPVEAVIHETVHKRRISNTMHLRYQVGGASSGRRVWSCPARCWPP